MKNTGKRSHAENGSPVPHELVTATRSKAIGRPTLSERRVVGRRPNTGGGGSASGSPRG
jgi:hypothetical protein